MMRLFGWALLMLFHAGHDRLRNIHAGSTQRMLNAYNTKLRRYLIDNH